jgi:hypothetical protein
VPFPNILVKLNTVASIKTPAERHFTYNIVGPMNGRWQNVEVEVECDIAACT